MIIRKFLGMILLVVLSTVATYSQNSTAVKGTIVNQIEQPMPEATVCVLTASDSILVNFKYSQSNGNFTIPSLSAGDFLLLVSATNYADFVASFSITAEKPIYSFDTIQLTRKDIVLEEVLIKARKNIMTINGDTLEYDAGAVKIQPNDKVEDLLRRLPGIQVDADGKIIAQGQVVTKVLVDGEEFFGDDPKLVTRNIRADMVDKIQVYDKKSEKDAFTGIDTSPKTRTINVQLKEDKKNGLFGKTLAGAGTDGYYQGQVMANRFKNNMKLAVYGTVANNGKNRLSYADFGSLGTSSINLPKKGLVGVGNDDALETYNGEFNGDGFPLAHNVGAHYSNKWNENKSLGNTDFQLGRIQIKGNSETQLQQNLNEGTLNTVVKEDFENRSLKTKLNGAYKYNAGSNFFSLGVIAGFDNFDVSNTYNSISLAESGALVNEQDRSVLNKGDHNAINLNAYYGKKLKKEKRNIGFSLVGNANGGNTEGFLNSNTKFAEGASVETVNQFKTSDIANSSISYGIEFTEPVWKYTTMTLKYGMDIDQSKANRKSFNYQ